MFIEGGGGEGDEFVWADGEFFARDLGITDPPVEAAAAAAAANTDLAAMPRSRRSPPPPLRRSAPETRRREMPEEDVSADGGVDVAFVLGLLLLATVTWRMLPSWLLRPLW